MNVIFLRPGPAKRPGSQGGDEDDGVTLAFAVDDGDGELARLSDEGAPVSPPLTDGDRGERAFQVRGPRGVVVQLLDWNASGGD